MGMRMMMALLMVNINIMSAAIPSPHPNIMLIVADDFGWSNAGWHTNDTQVRTPTLNKMVSEGLELDRMYVYKYCSPTRSSILSGRLPIHVTQYCNYESVPGAGIPIGMTLISEKLQHAGYRLPSVNTDPAPAPEPHPAPHPHPGPNQDPHDW